MTASDDAGATLDCRSLVELLTDYLDGVLDPGLSARIEAHLALCEGCATYLEQLRTTIDLVGEVPVDGLSGRATARRLALAPPNPVDRTHGIRRIGPPNRPIRRTGCVRSEMRPGFLPHPFRLCVSRLRSRLR